MKRFLTKRGYRGLGWRPSPPDHRDKRLMLPSGFTPLPPAWNLATDMAWTPAPDQLQLESCVVNEVQHVLIYTMTKAGIQPDPPMALSRLWAWYECRKREGTLAADDGVYIRDAVDVIHRLGIPPETEWPYIPSAFATQPPQQVYMDARAYLVGDYCAVALQPGFIKTAVLQGYPVLFGMAVFPQMMNAEETGEVAFPTTGEAPLGWHCVKIVGWDDTKDIYVCGTSWGPQWGYAADPARPDQKGWFTLPQAYVHDPALANDGWAIRSVVRAASPPIPPNPAPPVT